ncbi:MAG: acyltransferase [Chloroflexi bacterium]|nr:acyltransferase [Chloroflexota bacterium]
MVCSGLPGVGRLCLRLAGWWVGPYKQRRTLAYLTPRPYVSPAAQIYCPGLRLGPHCFIDDGVTIYAHSGGGTVELSQGVHLYRGCILEVGAGAGIVVGENTHIQANCNLKGFGGHLRIGANVQIAPGCAFSPYEHRFDDPEQPIRAQGIRHEGDIVIEDDVWMGVGVRVLDGVRIGRGAVIGAGAVVTKAIPAGAVAAGVPARVLRQRGQGQGA